MAEPRTSCASVLRMRLDWVRNGMARAEPVVSCPPVAGLVEVEGDGIRGRQVKCRGQAAEDFHVRIQVQHGVKFRQLPEADLQPVQPKPAATKGISFITYNKAQPCCWSSKLQMCHLSAKSCSISYTMMCHRS